MVHSLPRAKILLVGTDREMSRQCVRSLEASGYILEEAANVAEAIALLQSQRFHALLSCLPPSSTEGPRLADWSKEHPGSGGGPVVVCLKGKGTLTATQPELFSTQAEGSQRPVSGVLGPTLLLTCVEDALARYSAAQELTCLSRMMQALLEAEDIRQTLGLLVEQAADLVGAERGWLRVAASEDVFVQMDSASPCPEMRRENLQALEDCLARVNGTKVEPLSYFNNRLQSESKFAAAAVAAGMESLASVPLRRGKDLLGRIWLSNWAGGFTALDAELLQWFAERAAAILAGAWRWEELRLRAMTDGLTGLLNYRAFQAQLRHEIARVDRTGRLLTLLVIDVDGLKGINDRFGHLVGDEVIRSVSRSIQENARAADTMARWGGEEFLLLLADTSLEQARVVGERLREKISGLRVNPVPRMTFSMGGGCYPRQANSAAELIEVADRALYEAKQSGGNRLVLAQTEPVSVAV